MEEFLTPEKLGLIGLLGLLVVALVKEWIVPGTAHKRTLRERDKLFDLAVRSSTAADRSTSLATTMVQQALGEDEAEGLS